MKEKKIRGYLVEWDDSKNIKNEKKHGVIFEDAALVFEDDNRIEVFDEAHSMYEDRFIVIGMVNTIIVVVYTVREESIRIISSRVANKEEEKLYYGYYKNYC